MSSAEFPGVVRRCQVSNNTPYSWFLHTNACAKLPRNPNGSWGKNKSPQFEGSVIKVTDFLKDYIFTYGKDV